MDTSRDYYEDRIADFNRYRRGRNLYQFCKDEGIDYNWMLKAQRQFGRKGSEKKKDTGNTDDQTLIQLHFEDDMHPRSMEALPIDDEGTAAQAETRSAEHWKVSDLVITDAEGNEITLRCGSVSALGRILTRLADCHD